MLIDSFDYDASYIPAIPIIRLEVRSPQREKGVLIRAIVDSGADATIIPVAILNQIGTQKSDRAWLRGTVRERILVFQYEVWLQIGNHRPTYLQVVGDTQGTETILGRDILNQFIVTLNGLASVVEISD
jgi:predicted aspartyl protease